MDVEDVIENWYETISAIKKHIDIKRHQYASYQSQRDNLQLDEVLSHYENLQTAYFGQSSFSLVTACIYYVADELKSEPMVIISELPDDDHNNAFNCVKKVIEHIEQITFPTK